MELPIVQVRNLLYEALVQLIFDLFTQYGAVHEIRMAEGPATGTCFVVYANMHDAQRAAKEANGVSLDARYLVTKIYQADAEAVAKARLLQRKLH